jgi:hypothetical protein
VRLFHAVQSVCRSPAQAGGSSTGVTASITTWEGNLGPFHLGRFALS